MYCQYIAAIIAIYCNILQYLQCIAMGRIAINNIMVPAT